MVAGGRSGSGPPGAELPGMESPYIRLYRRLNPSGLHHSLRSDLGDFSLLSKTPDLCGRGVFRLRMFFPYGHSGYRDQQTTGHFL